jgi:hypothetical protein
MMLFESMIGSFFARFLGWFTWVKTIGLFVGAVGNRTIWLPEKVRFQTAPTKV